MYGLDYFKIELVGGRRGSRKLTRHKYILLLFRKYFWFPEIISSFFMFLNLLLILIEQPASKQLHSNFSS
jgi:hypothetical protein